MANYPELEMASGPVAKCSKFFFVLGYQKSPKYELECPRFTKASEQGLKYTPNQCHRLM